jgi:hypothetical protein
MNENLALFTVPVEVETGEQAVEPEREIFSAPLGSIRCYEDLQRKYWNEAFPWAKK